MAVVLNSEPTLLVAQITQTVAEGPGLRTALWVQGCSIRCAGCINPHLFTTQAGYTVTPSAIIEQSLAHGVEGLTLLGGEPFDQAEALSVLAAQAHGQGLGVICFTGFTFEDASAQPGGPQLLANIDLLVDGPYVASKPENWRALVGSHNQRFIHLTDRYSDYSPEQTSNRIDLRISTNGDVTMAGFTTSKKLDQLAKELESRRVRRR